MAPFRSRGVVAVGVGRHFVQNANVLIFQL